MLCFGATLLLAGTLHLLVPEAAAADQDESCVTLLNEFSSICFRKALPTAEAETEAFCQAFREACPETLSKLAPPGPKDVGKYCKKNRERFRYVCPDPTRFGKYSANAIEFCPRYQQLCPDEELPTEPEPFAEKHSKHIYIREYQYYCTLHDDWAKIYCFNPVILKVPKYQFLCLQYKIKCIDPQTFVLYAVGK